MSRVDKIEVSVHLRECYIFAKFFLQIQKLGLKPDMTSYNILLKACCVAGRVDLAQDMYKELKHLESVGQLKLDVFTYSTIIKV
jgi:pentatricopeptide repeat protein